MYSKTYFEKKEINYDRLNYWSGSSWLLLNLKICTTKWNIKETTSAKKTISKVVDVSTINNCIYVKTY